MLNSTASSPTLTLTSNLRTIMAKNKYNKPCNFCENKIRYIDYKNVKLIKRFVSQFNKIVPRYYTGNCLTHQKAVSSAVKNARIMALMPFVR